MTTGGTDDNLVKLEAREADAGIEPWVSQRMQRIQQDRATTKAANTASRPSDDVATLDAEW